MPGRREPARAWVVEWLDMSEDKPQMARTRLDIAAEPAPDEDAMARLSEAGAAVARMAAPDEPEPFGHAETGLVQGSEVHRRIELISMRFRRRRPVCVMRLASPSPGERTVC